MCGRRDTATDFEEKDGVLLNPLQYAAQSREANSGFSNINEPVFRLSRNLQTRGGGQLTSVTGHNE
jgi:hypothetical protein